MSRVAIVTDSAADLAPARAAVAGVAVVPLLVSFGESEFRAGVDITDEEFHARLTAPGAPFPRTAAAGPGAFQATYERLFAEGAEAVVAITVGGKLSATLQSARIARDALRDRPIHVVDSESASMGLGHLVLLAAESARAGAPAEEIVAAVERRRRDARLYVVLETLEYLKRGGRISGARAAIGSVLSVKPIITCEDGAVETADRPRTRGRARERLIELLAAEPVERVAVLHAQAPDIELFADDLANATGVPRAEISIGLIGPSVGPHVGPGAYGAAVLRRSS